MSGEFFKISSRIFLDFISSLRSFNVVSTIEVNGSVFFVSNSFNFSIKEKIEFKSLPNFLALLSSIEILDYLDMCFTVLRSIVI